MLNYQPNPNLNRLGGRFAQTELADALKAALSNPTAGQPKKAVTSKKKLTVAKVKNQYRKLKNSAKSLEQLKAIEQSEKESLNMIAATRSETDAVPAYPSNRSVANDVETIIDFEVREQMDEATKDACLKLAAALDAAYPFFERYKRFILTADFSETQLQKHFKGRWDKWPEKVREKFKREMAITRAAYITNMEAVDRLISTQQDLMRAMTDERLDEILEMQEALGLDQL